MSALAQSIVGVSRANGDRAMNDFYPTPPYATLELLKVETFFGEIWECACGDGAISRVLKDHGYDVFSSDIALEYADKKIDFLNLNSIKTNNIITNPPFKNALAFVEQSKKVSSNKIAMFLKTNFLASISRYEMFQDKLFPLKTVYQFCKRVDILKNGIAQKNHSMIDFAWFVWDKEWTGAPIIKWIK